MLETFTIFASKTGERERVHKAVKVLDSKKKEEEEKGERKTKHDVNFPKFFSGKKAQKLRRQEAIISGQKKVSLFLSPHLKKRERERTD